VVDVDRQSHPDSSQQREPSARELMKELAAELRGSRQHALPDLNSTDQILARVEQVERRLDSLEQESRGWLKRLLRR